MNTVIDSAIETQPQIQHELDHKLSVIRNTLRETGATGLRLRGTDWFSWATAGATHTVLLAAETGGAEVLVTENDAWILTDEIEAQRLQDEEFSGSRGEVFQIYSHPWAEAEKREAFVREVTGNGTVLRDRAPQALPSSLIQQKRILLPSELDRYRQVGRLASEAMTEVLTQAQPDWTEFQLAGAGAQAMWARGLHPALTLAAGERRLPLYRHPIPTHDRIGQIAMLVFCARGFGLYASLTRFVCFGEPSDEQQTLHQKIQAIEATALDQCRINTPLNQIYNALQNAYEQEGYPNAIREHHQGGTTGYLAREIIATPAATDRLVANTAIAFNPSLRGAKIEDTFVLREDSTLENLTLDPNWVSVEVHDRLRPVPLVIK